ncbi:MAG TPA: (d)CMP kinase [Smithellaceae bacterium]|mgnify:CR=1 FL=1|nr:(d)CMP kinase [Smithellaceae bacterium]
MQKKLIITIDGPAGAGKSTVSKVLAKELGYLYLDTGALYRALGYKVLKNKIALDDISALSALCFNTNVALKNIGSQLKVYVDGEDVGDKIRTEEVGLTASRISTYAVVRQSLLQLQREAGAPGGVVAEGRDMGSVVFPQADYKFFLDADIEERIKRRHRELRDKGDLSADWETVKKDMLARDKQDAERAIAPLKPTASSIIIDSTNLSVGEVVAGIIRRVAGG